MYVERNLFRKIYKGLIITIDFFARIYLLKI